MPVEAKADEHVTFRCPLCNCKVRAPRAKIGHRGRCPQCHRTVRVQEPRRNGENSRVRLGGDDGLIYMPLPSMNGGGLQAGYAGNALAMLATVCAVCSAAVFAATEGTKTISTLLVTASGVMFGLSLLAMGLARALNVIHRQLIDNAKPHWGTTLKLGGNGNGNGHGHGIPGEGRPDSRNGNG